MAYVVTDACTKDFLCAAECATFAIHPSPGEPGAEEATQVYINPDECLDLRFRSDLRTGRAARGQGTLRRAERVVLPVAPVPRLLPNRARRACGWRTG